MVNIQLNKKDAEIRDIKKPRDLTVAAVLTESRLNHNELVDAILGLTTMMTEINDRQTEINNRLTDLSGHKDIVDLGESITFNMDQVTKTVIPNLEARMNANLNRVKTDLLVKVDDNKDKQLLQEGHSRRLNIIIQGKDETASEDTEEVATNFLIHDLKMDAEDVSQFMLRDVHRLPKGKNRDGTENTKPRPIIMAFLRQKDRNTVMRSAYQLKGTDLSLKSDLPKHLNDLRSEMLKERLRLKGITPGIKYRVAERSYRPVLQRENGVVAGSNPVRIKWDTIKFPA